MTSSVSLIPCTPHHRPILDEWFDRGDIRIEQEIPIGMPSEEFVDILLGKSEAVYLIYCDAYPVGVVALVKQEDGYFQVPIQIAATYYRGNGIGKEALRIVTELHPDKNLVQKIRPCNARMLALSRRVGFVDKGVEGEYVRLERVGV